MLAVDAGIDRTYVSRLERGLENPSVAVLEKTGSRAVFEHRGIFYGTARRGGRRAAARPGQNMKGKGRGLPPNVVTLRAFRPRVPSTAAILEGLKLMQVFLRIETARDRKTVLDLAKQLALDGANRKT